MTSLREQMAVDAAAILDTACLGEKLRYTESGASGFRQVVCRFIAQPERQTVKRAFIWTKTKDVKSPAAGDLYTLTRGRNQTKWRVLYSDFAETALQRHICHEQLPSLVTIIDRDRFKSIRSADDFLALPQSAQLRAKIYQTGGEHVASKTSRKFRSEFEIYFETLPSLTTDQVIVDSDGRAFRIDVVERSSDRMELPYISAKRIDS